MENITQPHVDATQSPDTIFALLSDRRRRYVSKILSEQDLPIGLHQLATAVASWETGTASDEVSAETTAEIATTLHHVHLPKLADADVIDYDTATNTVTATRTERLPFAGATGNG